MPALTDGRWETFNTEQEVKQRCSHPTFYRVQHIDWAGPGRYYVRTYRQRCPRNCCYESVISIMPKNKRAEELVTAIRELAGELREART